MQGNKIWTGTGKRLRDRGNPDRGARDDPAGAADVGLGAGRAGGQASEKPKALAEMIDRDYGPELIRIEMFARPPFDRPGWHFWGDAAPGGLMFTP